MQIDVCPYLVNICIHFYLNSVHEYVMCVQKRVEEEEEEEEEEKEEEEEEEEEVSVELNR